MTIAKNIKVRYFDYFTTAGIQLVLYTVCGLRAGTVSVYCVHCTGLRAAGKAADAGACDE